MAAGLSETAFLRPLWPRVLLGGLLTLMVHAAAFVVLKRGLGEMPAPAPTQPPVRVSLLQETSEAVRPYPEPLSRPRVRQPPPQVAPRPKRAPTESAPEQVAAASPAQDPDASPAPEPAVAPAIDAGAGIALAATPDAEGPMIALGAPVPSADRSGVDPAPSEPGAENKPAPFVEPPLLYGSALGMPPAGRSRFQVYYGDYASNNPVAILEYALETNGDRYLLRTEGRALGLISLIYSGLLTQVSRGRLGENGLLPERYAEQRGRGGERGVHIDRERGRAEFSNGAQVALEPGAQDRLSMLIQLGLIGRAQPERLSAGQRLRLPEFGARSIHPAVFESLGDALLSTRQGDLRTVHLVRRPVDRQRDPEIDIWLGYDHQLMPVRIRLTDSRGRVLDQLLMR